MDIEAQTELGFTVSKRLIFEIMGKHSNIVLVALDTGKIIDSIKRISIDVNRYRQLLPGLECRYPPKQDKVPFKGNLWRSCRRNWIRIRKPLRTRSICYPTFRESLRGFPENWLAPEIRWNGWRKFWRALRTAPPLRACIWMKRTSPWNFI